MVIPSFAASHEQYYYKIGLHWHQAMHGDSDTFNVQGDDIIRSICTTWHSLINIFHLKRWYNDFKYTRRNIIASAKLPFKCAVGMWEFELVESWLK